VTGAGASGSDPGPGRDEQFWREYLENPDSPQKVVRQIFARLPAEPRCQMCASPFSGLGGRLLRVVGQHQSTANPRMCNRCEKVLIKHHGGAEIDSTMLFADIRGSTSLAEGMSPGDFRTLLDRFYAAATEAVFANGGVVDKFVGDEMVAVFPPLMGADHAKRAVAAALDILRATGHADPDGPWVPVGAGVNTGRVWFGALGDDAHVEISVVGDAVNIAARLAGAASAGEVIVTAETARVAGLDADLATRMLELKGKELSTEVVTLRVD
jgi:adenylate cyclase